MSSIIAHDKKQPSYEDEEISIGDRPKPKNAKTKPLEALGATLNFIDFWFKMFHHNYEVICGIYNKAMIKLLKKHQQGNQNHLVKIKNIINY